MQHFDMKPLSEAFFRCHYFVSKVYYEVCLVYIKDHFSLFLLRDFYLGGGDRRVSLNTCE